MKRRTIKKGVGSSALERGMVNSLLVLMILRIRIMRYPLLLAKTILFRVLVALGLEGTNSVGGRSGGSVNWLRLEMDYPNARGMDLGDLRGVGSDILDNIESVRAKSSNLKDDLSARIKNGIRKMRDLINICFSRLEQRGDVELLKEENQELKAKLRLAELEEFRINGKIEILKRQTKEMQTSIDSLSILVKESQSYGDRVHRRILEASSRSGVDGGVFSNFLGVGL